MYIMLAEIPGVWVLFVCVQKMEIPGMRGAFVKFPPSWGYGNFLEPHNSTICISHNFRF